MPEPGSSWWAARSLDMPPTRTIGDGIGQPPVVGLGRELEHPARHLHARHRVGELGHERLQPSRVACVRYAAARRTPQDLALLLEAPPPDLLARLAQLGGLAPRLAGIDARTNVAAPGPLMQRHREDAEVVGDLLDHHSGSAFLSDAHDTATFFQGSPPGQDRSVLTCPFSSSSTSRDATSGTFRCPLLVMPSPLLRVDAAKLCRR